MKKLLLLFVVTLMSVMATAYDLSDNNGLHYNIKGDGTLEVVGLESEKRTADILSDVTINGNTYQVTSIGAYAFEGRSDITYLSIPWSVKSIGEYAFIDCGSSITVNIADPESWCQMKLGNEHSSPLSSAGKVLVHDMETTSIDIPEGVTSIGNFTFYQCRSIISLNIPSTVKSIGSSAFEDCTGLTSLTLSEGLQSIGGSAFQGCTGLQTLTIPSTVNSISINAFANCTGLISIVSEIDTPFRIDENTFSEETYLNAQLIIPAGEKTEYRSRNGWNKFQNIVEVDGVGSKFEVDGILYIIGENNTVSIKRGKSGDVVIPSQVSNNGETYDVTGIERLAFNALRNLTSITIPSSITSIGYEAFCDCYRLTSVHITDLEAWCKIDFNFPDSQPLTYAHHLYLNGEEVKDLIIPNSISRIGWLTFYGCSGLTTVTIPNNVTSIGVNAFKDCSSLTSIMIPNSVTSIGRGAFQNCTGLEIIDSNIEWPSIIEENTFSEETYLNAQLIVPAGTKSAYQSTDGWNKFQNIVEGTYDNPQKLTIHVPVAGMLPYLISEDQKYQIEDLTLTGELNGTDIRFIRDMSGINYQKRPNCMTFCDYQSFSTPGILKVLDITNANIVSGGDCYYAWTKNRTDDIHDEYYTVTNSVTRNMFYKLQSIKLPNSVTSIGESAFSGCSGLTSITIPNSVTSIGHYAFYDCSGLTSVTIPNSVMTIGSSAFYGCSGLTTIVTEIENPFEIEPYVFGSSYTTATLIVPKGTKAAYQSTDGWNEFQNIIEADEITDNDVNYTIEGETAVVSMSTSVKGELKIEESVEVDGKTYQVTAIASGAFQGNVEITSVVIPNSIETIGASAFEGCTGISTIIIGKAVKEIASRAFAEIFSNKTGTRAEGVGIDVYCYAEEVPITGGDAFDGTPTELSTLHVPLSAIEKYKTSWPWSDFKEIVPLANSSFTQNGINYAVKDDGTLEVTGIEDGTTIVDLLSDVYIDGNTYQVTSIGAYAFEGRSDISYLSIPWSVTSIGEYAFVDCGSNLTVNIADPESWCQMKLGNEHSSPLSSARKVLVHDIETTSIDIPEGVTSIGNFTFYQCRSIISLNIPSTVKSIGSSAFEDCTGLTSLTLSEGLQSIGGSAFQGCTGLQFLTIPRTVKSIYINAFANCKGITDVYCYAETVPETHFDAFDSTPTEKSTLHVPANAVEAYRTTWPWSDFKDIVSLASEDPNGIVEVKQFDDCKGLYYDIYGRRIHQVRHKGLYIQNGKKIVVK